MKQKLLKVCGTVTMVVGGVALPGMSFAVAPAYITDAITTATTTFTDYISAAAPGLFSIITIVAGLFLVVKLLKKSTH